MVLPPLLHSPSEKGPLLSFSSRMREAPLPLSQRMGKKIRQEGGRGKNGRRGLAAEKVIGGGIYTAPFGKRAIASFFWVLGGGREVLGLREGRGISRKVKREGGRGSIESNPPFLSVSINFFDRPYVSNIFEK